MIGTCSAQLVLGEDQPLGDSEWGTLRQEELWPLPREGLHLEGAQSPQGETDTRQLGKGDNSHDTKTQLITSSFKRGDEHWMSAERLLTKYIPAQAQGVQR